MIAVGRPGIEHEYGFKDWSVCTNGESPCFQVGNPSRAMVGTNAGTFYGSHGQFPGGGFGAECWVFLYQDSTGWHYVNGACAQDTGAAPGRADKVWVTGCANFRDAPGLSTKVLGCLANGTVVDVDSAPVYQDGHLWWHLAGRGWMAHDYLVAPH